MRMTFSLMDDALLSAYSGRKDLARHALAAVNQYQIGPATEFVLIYEQGFQTPFAPAELPKDAVINKLLAIDRPTRSNELSLDPEIVEFRRMPFETSDFRAAAWTAFGKRLEFAVRGAGFSDRISAGIAGTFQEMADNAVIHSELVATAVGGYQWSKGEFEFVVADRGIGVLESLRKCPESAHLCDHGEALIAAVTQGASRFGAGTGHGNGFRQLLSSLVALGGELRFRSGDQVLAFRGGAVGGASAQLFQRPPFRGFLVSVRCTT
jgi:hypothetical protein